MAGAPALSAFAANAPGRASRHAGLRYLLPVSLALHLALLAWPSAGPAGGGAARAELRGASLTATLEGGRAIAGEAVQQRSGSTRERRHADTRRAPPAPAQTPPATATSADEAPPSTPSFAPFPTSAAATSRSTAPPPAMLAGMRTATVFYPADQLSVRPRALDEPLLQTPALDSLVATGEIEFTLWIDERGRIADLSVERSDLPEAFAQTATDAFRALRFAPGEIDGQPVGTVLRIAVRYEDERLAGDHGAAAVDAAPPAT